jgi:hypothetical protein
LFNQANQQRDADQRPCRSHSCFCA